MNRIFSLAAMLCISLLFSCAPDIELPPPPPGYSSSLLFSSSSVTQSLSSAVISSSSVVIPSSSSSTLLPSSSSIKPSSSSAVVSSSSIVIPSSSSSVITGVGLCDDFVDGTPREHYGKSKAQFCDSRDGKKYVYVKIGEQTWMAENLNYNATGSKCNDNSEANCKIYGRLYNWSTAMIIDSKYNSTSYTAMTNHTGICPFGWHLPTRAEWDVLTVSVGGFSTEGRYLRTTSGWNSCGNGSSYLYQCEDKYGFSALPGNEGFPDDTFGTFGNVGGYGLWWTTNEIGSIHAYCRRMDYNGGTHWTLSNDGEAAYWDGAIKDNLLSVRCLQD